MRWAKKVRVDLRSLKNMLVPGKDSYVFQIRHVTPPPVVDLDIYQWMDGTKKMGGTKIQMSTKHM